MVHDTRPTVLVPVTYGFSVRYLVPTGLLSELGRVCRPVVALGWDEPRLVDELTAAGITVVRLPSARLGADYVRLRRQLAVVHESRLGSVTTTIQRRHRSASPTRVRSRVRRSLRDARDRFAATRPGGAANLESCEVSVTKRATNIDAFGQLLDEVAADLVLSVTPYHDQDGLLLRSATERGVSTMTSIISFDNPTTRARMIAPGDRILVWNRYNAAEIVRSYPEVHDDRVVVVGAPQFDLHTRADLVLREDEWRRRAGLPSNRPIVLYGAGPASLVPGERALVELIDRAIDTGETHSGASDERPFLLVRRHPNDAPDAWSGVAERLRHGVVADPWAPGSTRFGGWPTRDDLMIQMSSLCHSAVHVNVCSSMTIDGAMFDRPQIGPTFVPGESADSQRRVADFYRQEHWLPIARSGGLATAQNERELAGRLGEALRHPERRQAGRRRLVRDLLTFDDGKSSERVVAEVEAALARR